MTGNEIETLIVAIFFRTITFYAPIIIFAFIVLLLLKKLRFPNMEVDTLTLVLVPVTIAVDMILMHVFDVTLFILK